MHPTRVRVILEYRNGNGNFVQQVHHPGFVSCSGFADISALDSAYLLALQTVIDREKVLADCAQHAQAGHD